LLERMQGIALEIILQVVLGAEGEAFRSLQRVIASMLAVGTRPEALLLMLLIGPEWFDRLRPAFERLTPYGRLVAHREALFALLREEMNARRNTEGSRRDVLSLLLLARDEAGAPMTEAEIL